MIFISNNLTTKFSSKLVKRQKQTTDTSYPLCSGRWGLSAQEGSLEKLTLNLSKHGKSMKLNPDRKSREENWRQLAINTDQLLATPAAKPAPNVMPCILLDLVCPAERDGGDVVWAAYIPLPRLVPCKGHSIHTTEFWTNRMLLSWERKGCWFTWSDIFFLHNNPGYKLTYMYQRV